MRAWVCVGQSLQECKIVYESPVCKLVIERVFKNNYYEHKIDAHYNESYIAVYRVLITPVQRNAQVNV